MPVYQFTCPVGHVEEHLVGITADSVIPSLCATCGQALAKDGAYLTSYEVDGNTRDAQTGELVTMRYEERYLHAGQARSIEEADKAGTLRRYKKGKKTPMDLHPSFEKILPNT